VTEDEKMSSLEERRLHLAGLTADITDEQLNPAIDPLERLREAGGMPAFIMTTSLLCISYIL
jgi:hypothetical protein